MDKDEYCEQMEKNLCEVTDRLERLAFPPPSTLEASRQQDKVKLVVEDLKTRIAEALEKLRALRTRDDSPWETAKQDIDRRWREISKLKEKVLR